jgi:hypothetical protein
VSPPTWRTFILEIVRITKKISALLLGVAAWNVVTYAVFIRNLAKTEGRPTGFYVAHTVLIVVNLVIAGVLGTIGWKALRAERNNHEHRDRVGVGTSSTTN